jgi:signal transduction histidine kinase
MAMVLTLILSWLLELRVREQVSLEYFAQLQQLIFAYGIGFSLLFLVLGWVLAGGITRPLSEIAVAAQRISQGHSEEVIPTFPGHDELASLSRSLNLLVTDLNQQKIALQGSHAELEARVSERTRQLSTLYDMLAVNNNVEDDLSSRLKQALGNVLAVTGTSIGGIHLLNQAGTSMEMVAENNMLPEITAALQTLPLDHPLLTRILQERAYLYIPDLSVNPYTAAFTGLSQNKQFLGFPIRKGERNLGTISVILQETQPLDETAIGLFHSLADHLAIVVENDHLRQQSERLAVVEERNRLARELHDSVTQSLYSATLFAEAGQRNAKAGKMDKAIAYLAEVGETSHQALKEMRLLVHKLRPSALDKEGLIPAVDQRLKAVEERAGIEHELTVEGELHLSNDLESVLYAIVLESLNNALKHARATAVSVHFSQTSDRVGVSVRDNGRGFDLKTALLAGGLGLTSLQERVAQLNGTIEIQSSLGEGTNISVQIPNDPKQREVEK